MPILCRGSLAAFSPFDVDLSGMESTSPASSRGVRSKMQPLGSFAERRQGTPGSENPKCHTLAKKEAGHASQHAPPGKCRSKHLHARTICTPRVTCVCSRRVQIFKFFYTGRDAWRFCRPRAEKKTALSNRLLREETNGQRTLISAVPVPEPELLPQEESSRLERPVLAARELPQEEWRRLEQVQP